MVSCTAPSEPRTRTRWCPESETTIRPCEVEATLPGKESVRSSRRSDFSRRSGLDERVPSARASESWSDTNASSTDGSGSPGATAASVPSGLMITSVGQLRTAYCDQSCISLSTATGCATPWRCMARRICSVSFSASNLAECTPITTSGSSRCLSSRSRSTGSTCMQLMQQ